MGDIMKNTPSAMTSGNKGVVNFYGYHCKQLSDELVLISSSIVLKINENL